MPPSRLTTLALTLLLAFPLAAQNDPTPTLRVNARLVVLDIVVTDAAGHSVDNLSAKDFAVFEENKPQRIRSLEPPTSHALPAETIASGISAAFDPAHPATFGRSPANILVLDQLNTHFEDSSFARRSLHDFLATQPALLPQPTTLLTLYDNRFKTLAPFTRDRDAILRALAAAPTEYAWRLEVNGKADHGPLERLDQSLRALEEIAQSNAAIPGRKNLIWVGGGFPTLDPENIDSGDAKEVKDTLQHVTDVLLDTRVTLYAIDPTSSAASVSEITDASQMAFAQAAADSSTGSIDPFNANEDFDRLAPITGGRVVRGMNDIAHQIASASNLGANFYTLAYSPDSTSESASQYRRIRIDCLRPGLTITTRAGYYSGQSQQEKSTATAAYDLTTAAESRLPLNGLHLTVEPDKEPASPPSTWLLHVNASALTWKTRSDGSSTASVYVLAASLDGRGKLIAHTLHGMTAQARPGTNLADPTRQASFLLTAPPSSPKAATLRFIIRDSATGRMGSVDLPKPALPTNH